MTFDPLKANEIRYSVISSWTFVPLNNNNFSESNTSTQFHIDLSKINKEFKLDSKLYHMEDWLKKKRRMRDHANVT